MYFVCTNTMISVLLGSGYRGSRPLSQEGPGPQSRWKLPSHGTREANKEKAGTSMAQDGIVQ